MCCILLILLLSLWQGLFEAHPQLQEMFPGGIVQFAQRVGQMPDEVLDNLLIFEDGGMGIAQPAAGGGGAMPGGIGFEEINIDGGNGDVDDNAGNAAGAPVEARDVAAEATGDDSGEEGDEEEDDENHDAPVSVTSPS